MDYACNMRLFHVLTSAIFTRNFHIYSAWIPPKFRVYSACFPRVSTWNPRENLFHFPPNFHVFSTWCRSKFPRVFHVFSTWSCRLGYVSTIHRAPEHGWKWLICKMSPISKHWGFGLLFSKNSYVIDGTVWPCSNQAWISYSNIIARSMLRHAFMKDYCYNTFVDSTDSSSPQWVDLVNWN